MGLGRCHATPCDLCLMTQGSHSCGVEVFLCTAAQRRTTERLEGLRLLVRRRHSSIHLTGIFSPRLRLDAATYSRPWRDNNASCSARKFPRPTMASRWAQQCKSPAAGSRQHASSSQRTSQLHTSRCFGRTHSSRLSTSFRLTLIDCHVSAGGTISSFASSSSATWEDHHSSIRNLDAWANPSPPNLSSDRKSREGKRAVIQRCSSLLYHRHYHSQ